MLYFFFQRNWADQYTFLVLSLEKVPTVECEIKILSFSYFCHFKTLSNVLVNNSAFVHIFDFLDFLFQFLSNYYKMFNKYDL